jgi:serine/threonine protein kinase
MSCCFKCFVCTCAYDALSCTGLGVLGWRLLAYHFAPEPNKFKPHKQALSETILHVQRLTTNSEGYRQRNDYLHRTCHVGATVIHRDLKPDKVGFTDSGELKLFDFGLSTCVRKSGDPSAAYEVRVFTVFPPRIRSVGSLIFLSSYL